MILLNTVMLVINVGLLISAKTVGGAICFGLGAGWALFGISWGIRKELKRD